MNCRFSFKQVKRSEVLVEFAQPKILAKIEKYSTKPIDAHITFTKQGFNFIVRCSVKGGDGFNFQVEASSHDLYSTLDLMLAKLETQLKKQKEKLKRHKYPEEANLYKLFEAKKMTGRLCQSTLAISSNMRSLGIGPMADRAMPT